MTDDQGRTPATGRHLREALAPGRFAHVVELVPWRGPLGDDAGIKVRALAAELGDHPAVDALSVTDNAGGHAMLVARGDRHRARRGRPRGDRPRDLPRPQPQRAAEPGLAPRERGDRQPPRPLGRLPERGIPRHRPPGVRPRFGQPPRPVRRQQPGRDRAGRGVPRGPARSGSGGRGARPGPGLREARAPTDFFLGCAVNPLQAGRARPRAPVPEARGEGPGGRSLRDPPGRLRPAEDGRARPIRRGAGPAAAPARERVRPLAHDRPPVRRGRGPGRRDPGRPRASGRNARPARPTRAAPSSSSSRRARSRSPEAWATRGRISAAPARRPRSTR